MATFTFTAGSESKDQEAKSGKYETTRVPFKFDYYTLSFQHKLYNIKRVSPNGFPNLFSNDIIPRNLVKGYLYLFFEKRDGLKPENNDAWEEYHINPYSIVRDEKDEQVFDEVGNRIYSILDDNIGYYYKLRKEQDSAGRRKWLNLDSLDNPKDFIEFSETDIVWIAYSPIQWSTDFLVKTLESEKRRTKRFQKLDIAEWLGMEENPFTGSIQDTIWGLHSKNAIEDEKTIDYRPDGESLIFYSYKKSKIFPKIYYFTLHAPLNLVEDVVEQMDISIKEFTELADSLVMGNAQTSTEEKEQYYGLYTSALSLYHLLYESNSPLAKYKDDKLIQLEKIEVLLAVKKRNELRTKLYWHRDDLGNILKSSYYQYILMDVFDNIPSHAVEGVNVVLSHIQSLIFKPSSVDFHLLLAKEQEEIREKDKKWDDFIINSFFASIKEHEELTLEEVEQQVEDIFNKQKLIDNWENSQPDNIVPYLLNHNITLESIADKAYSVLEVSYYANRIVVNIDEIITAFGNKKLGTASYFQIIKTLKSLSKEKDTRKFAFDNLTNQMKESGFEKLIQNSKNAEKLPDDKKAQGEAFLQTRKGLRTKLRQVYGKLAHTKGKVYRLEEDIINKQIVNTYGWKSLVRNLAIFNLTYNAVNLFYSKNGEESSLGANVISLAGAGADFTAIKLSIFADARMIEGKESTIKVFGRKFSTERWSKIFGRVGGGFTAAVDIYYARQAYKNEENLVCALYIGSAAFTAGAVVFGVATAKGVGTLGVSAALAGTLAMACGILVIAIAIAIIIFSDDEFQRFFKNCVLSGMKKYRIKGGQYTDSSELAQVLYGYRNRDKNAENSLNQKFECFWLKIDMANFVDMADVILSWLSPVQFKPITLSQQFDRLSAPYTRLMPTTNIFKKIFHNNAYDTKTRYMIYNLALGIPLHGGLWNTAGFYHEAYIYPYGTDSNIRINMNKYIKRTSEHSTYNQISKKTTFYSLFEFDFYNAFKENGYGDYKNMDIDPEFVFMGFFVHDEENMQETYPSYKGGIPRFFGIKLKLEIGSTQSLSTIKLNVLNKSQTEIIRYKK